MHVVCIIESFFLMSESNKQDGVLDIYYSYCFFICRNCEEKKMEKGGIGHQLVQDVLRLDF